MGENDDQREMTQLLKDWRAGDSGSARKIEPIVYATLRRIAVRQMNREDARHTLQATALINDAYMQLLGGDVSWVDSAHFRALAATIMRRILIDHARAKRAQKREGDRRKVELVESRIKPGEAPVDVLELNDVLEKLATFDERKAKVVELTFFGGMSYDEVASVLGVSKMTVNRELRLAKAWLYKELQG